jgi:hypothetical protein
MAKGESLFLSENKGSDIIRRFDDTYKILLIIGPVLSFSLNSYSSSDVVQRFVQDLGFSILMISALLWALPNLFAGRMQYNFKLIGFVLLIFVFLILCAIVFIQGQFRSFAWYLIVAALLVLVTYLTSNLLAEGGVVSPRYKWVMVAFSVTFALILIPVIVL